jgi:hypothetical protein
MELSKDSLKLSPEATELLATEASHVVVRYDSACSLCTTLAGFMGQRVAKEQMTFEPSETPRPEQLEIEMMIEGQKVELSGKDAWLWLTEHHPSLREVHWLAQKLGITGVAAGAMMRGADVLRRFCFRCR